jgi:hypothetical protein
MKYPRFSKFGLYQAPVREVPYGEAIRKAYCQGIVAPTRAGAVRRMRDPWLPKAYVYFDARIRLHRILDYVQECVETEGKTPQEGFDEALCALTLFDCQDTAEEAYQTVEQQAISFLTAIEDLDGGAA